MKKTVYIIVALALQLFYYLSIFDVISVDIFSNFWARFFVTLPFWLVGYFVVDSCVESVSKGLYNVVYIIVLACSVAVHLNIAGVYLGIYTHEVLFTTLFPLSYGAYMRCKVAMDDGIEEGMEEFPYSTKFFEPYEPQEPYTPALIEYTREEMLAALPQSSELNIEMLNKIKEQLVGGLQKLSVEVERVKMNVGERSLTLQLHYNTIPAAVRASGFPCNLNIFYRLESVDREEQIMIIDVPYKEQYLL